MVTRTTMANKQCWKQGLANGSTTSDTGGSHDC